MTAEEAVTIVVEHVRQTGITASEAVKTLWKELQPISDSDNLIQFALAARVSLEYRRPAYSNPGKRISVQHEKYISNNFEVKVELLQDTYYRVNGKVKSIAACNRIDILGLAENAQAAEQGFSRYRQFWEYIASRLQSLKKDTVADLALEEQTKIARMLMDVHAFQLPTDLRSLSAG